MCSITLIVLFLYSVAALESPDIAVPPAIHRQFPNEPRKQQDPEELELWKFLQSKRKYSRRRPSEDIAPPPKLDHHSNGFINRNSGLIKDLHPREQSREKREEGEPVVQVKGNNSGYFAHWQSYYFHSHQIF